MIKTQIYYFLSFMMMLSNQLCGQSKIAKDEKATERISNLYKDVKFKGQAVNYHAEIQIGGCAFEVYINDMPVYKYAGEEGSGSLQLSAPINMNILRSGTQTWEVRVFPPQLNGKRLGTLPEGVKLELSVEVLKFRSTGVDHHADPLVLLSTPKAAKGNRMVYAGAGKPFMVYKGTFKAEVPYQLKGWTESVDLSEEDSTALKQELVETYEKYSRWLEKRDLAQLALGLSQRDRDRAQATFYDKALNEDHLQTFLDRYGAPNLKMLPIEHYKMVLSGNGKMVSLERADHLYYPVLIGESHQQAGGIDKVYTMTYYLNFHRPRKGEPLEVIR